MALTTFEENWVKRKCFEESIQIGLENLEDKLWERVEIMKGESDCIKWEKIAEIKSIYRQGKNDLKNLNYETTTLQEAISIRDQIISDIKDVIIE